MAEKFECIVVEDQESARVWLASALGAAFPNATIRAAANLREGVALIDEVTPELMLVDLGLPDGSGVELIGKLAQRRADAIIVVATVFADDEHLLSAIRAGAQGYILKDESKEELAALLQGIVNGHPPLSPTVARRLLDFIKEPDPDEPPIEHELSEREAEVLTLLAKGYSSVQTAELLNIRPNTVSGYVKIIYRKLNVNSRAEATLEAARLGFVENPRRPH